MLLANQKSDSELNSHNSFKCLSLLLHWKVNICKAFQTESVYSSYADYSIRTCMCIHVSTNDIMREILVNFIVEHCTMKLHVHGSTVLCRVFHIVLVTQSCQAYAFELVVFLVLYEFIQYHSSVQVEESSLSSLSLLFVVCLPFQNLFMKSLDYFKI